MVSVRAVRQALGISLREVARRAGISHPLLSRAERNPALFYPALRRRVAEALGISEDRLFPAQPGKKEKSK